MDKRTVQSAHQRIDKIESELKPLQRSVQRIENILIASAGATIMLLISVLFRMG